MYCDKFNLLTTQFFIADCVWLLKNLYFEIRIVFLFLYLIIPIINVIIIFFPKIIIIFIIIFNTNIIIIELLQLISMKRFYSRRFQRGGGEDKRFKYQYVDVVRVEILVNKIIDVDLILPIKLTVS